MQTEPFKANPPKRKRRWFQFSLRTLLLVVVTIAAVQCAVCLPMLREWQERVEWRDAGGTGSIGPFAFTIHCGVGRVVRRQPRASRRFAPVRHVGESKSATRS
jgi:hypothetical protein